MKVTVENSWVLSLSLAARCGGAATGEPSSLLFLAGVSLIVFLATAFFYWAHPGGPAWGRYCWTRGRRTTQSTIPGPRGLPFIGSMSLMTGLAHHKLAAAAEKHGAGRLMAISLGCTRVVVTSDSDVAKEILNSSAFADRPVKESAYGLMFHRAIGFAPYGVYWRTLRRIAATHLFCPKQIAASAAQRAHIAVQMVEALGRGVPVRDVLRKASLHNVMWSVFGRRYELGSNSAEMSELRLLVDEGYDLLGKLNWSDHLPMPAGIDLQGIRSRCSGLVPRVSHFVSNIIQEHRQPKVAAGDFVDVLLSLQGSDRLSDADMVAVLWEMIFRGTDTVAVLIEWTLARLVLHPDVQARVHAELDGVVGRRRPLAEVEAAALPYLQAVIKETLRLHPPGPLLSWARLATSDVRIGGLVVPAGTTAMVNMWAITHDPHVWEDPLEFQPSRFLAGDGGGEFPILGTDLRLAPFGSGRRSCPGKALAMATVTFWLAALMQEYDWAPTVGEGTRVDLTEVLKLSCEMKTPLAVQLIPRRACGTRCGPPTASVQNVNGRLPFRYYS